MQETPEQNLFSADEPHSRRRRLLALSLILLGGVSIVLMIASSLRAAAFGTALREESLTAEFTSSKMQEPSVDFSKFSHTQTHAALPCLVCHRRENNSPQISLPGHTPCSGCHTQRFNDPRNPICTVCHTDVPSGALKTFPSLKSFNMRFNHALHSAGAARPAAGCAACHQAQARGVARSIPAGFNAHATCFQCHAPRAQDSAGRNISSCSTCHSAGSYARTVARRAGRDVAPRRILRARGVTLKTRDRKSVV